MADPLPDTWRLGRTLCLCLLFSSTLVVGLAYVMVQWIRLGAVADKWFVALLLVATAFLIERIRHVYQASRVKAPAFFLGQGTTEEATSARAKSQEFLNRIFDSGTMTAAGLIYGSCVAGAVAGLRVWPQDSVIRWMLVAFLFVVNVSTGAGMYGMIRFFVEFYKVRDLIHVDLWQRHTASATFINWFRTQIAWLATIYVMLAQFSILLSVIPVGTMITGYAIFASLVIVSGFVLPGILMSQRLRSHKKKALEKLDVHINEEVMSAMQEVDHPGGCRICNG